MKNFLITESEKSRILGMHYNAMGKTLVNEQNEKADPLWSTRTGITNISEPDADRMEEFNNFDIGFRTSKSPDIAFNYRCITDPSEKPTTKVEMAGTIFDSNGNIYNATDIGLKADYLTIFKQYCKPTYGWLARYNAKNAPKPQAQVAGAKVMAPNPLPDVDVAAAQKREAETKAKREKATTDLKTLMDTPGFLKTTDSNGDLITDKTTLDAQVKELDRVLNAGGIPTGVGQPVQDLLLSMRNLVKRFPEYGETLNGHISNLRQ